MTHSRALLASPAPAGFVRGARVRAWAGRAFLTVAALLVFLGPLARPAAAQTRADSAAVLVAAAERFEAAGQADVADAIYSMVVARFAGTPAAETARLRLVALPQTRQARAGLAELTVWGTLFGLWAGVAVPLIVDDSPSSEAIGLGLLVGGPAGFLGSRAYARSRNLDEGAARAITFGGTWGTWQGFGWRAVLDAGESTVCPIDDGPFGGECFEADADGSEVVAWGLAGTLVGVGVGAALSRLDITPGTASAVSFGGLWGTWYGVAASQIIDSDADSDTHVAAALIGGNTGVVASALLAPAMELSRNRARVISIAGVVGLLGGLGLDLILQPDDARVGFLIPAATSALGLALGVGTTRDYDRPDTPGGEAGPAEGALLQLRGGRWSTELPAPAPRLLHETLPGRRGSSNMVLGITLFDARFF